MSKKHLALKILCTILLVMSLGVCMDAEAGFFGFGGTSWKEEVLLHDGSKIIVGRSQSRGGRHEIGQSPPVKEHDLIFTLPGSQKKITWKDEYSEDVGHSNFDLLALHIMNNTPYIVASPFGCLAYNKWGRPNPPYVIFRYDGKAWQHITLIELPVEFKNINLVKDTDNDEKQLTGLGLVTAEQVKTLNSGYQQPEYQTILREALPNGGKCIKTDYYGKAGWLSPDWFTNQPSLEACLKFCEHKKISAEICPCITIYKRK